MTKLEKARYSSAIDRINSNLKYARKQGLEDVDLFQEFNKRSIRFGARYTASGNISKRSQFTLNQLKSLEEASHISSGFLMKYGKDKKVKDVQKFLNTKIEYIYEKIQSPENEEEFEIAKQLDKMLEDGLSRYEYAEIWGYINKIGGFSTDFRFNPFLNKYPSRSERRSKKYGQRNNQKNNKK